MLTRSNIVCGATQRRSLKTSYSTVAWLAIISAASPGSAIPDSMSERLVESNWVLEKPYRGRRRVVFDAEVRSDG